MTDRIARLLLLVVLASLVGSVGPAGAQDARDDAPVGLTVTGLTRMVGAGTRAPDATAPEGADDLSVRALVENTGSEPIADLSLSVEVFAPIETRSELHHVLDGAGSPGGLLEPETVQVAEGEQLDPGEVAAVTATVTSTSIGWASSGVHPVRVSVLRGTTRLDDVVTAVVSLAAPPTSPLPATLGWPLDSAPRRAIGDVFTAGSDDAVLPGGRLERLVWALEQGPADAVQLLTGAHVLGDLAARADGFRLADDARGPVAADEPRARSAQALLERIRAYAEASPVPTVAAPYADADVSALQQAGLELQAVRDVTEGRSRLEDLLGERPRPETLWVTTPLAQPAIRDVLGPAGVTEVILSWDQVATGGELPDRTPPPVLALRSGGVAVGAIVADPWLESLLADLPNANGTVIAVQRILVETALVHLERPGADEGRGVLLLPPRDWDPPAQVAAGLLDALVTAPWVRLMSAADLAVAYGRPAEPATLTAADPGLPPQLRSLLTEARDDLAALRDAVPDRVESVEGYRWEDIERALQRVPSGWWIPDDTQRARALLGDVRAAIDAGFGRVHLPPDAQVTLTDTEGRIPVTVSRPAGPPIRVIVEMDAPARLEFPDGNVELVTLEEGGQQTISFRVVAQASGRIPVTVRVKSPGAVDPSGAPWRQLAAETLVVQSTVISGTALVVLGVVLAALFVWWLVRRRRPPDRHLTVVRDEAA